MKTIFKILKDIENKPTVKNFTPAIPYLLEDNETQRIKDIVVPELLNVEQEINEIFFVKIKGCKSIQEANHYFEILDTIQEILAMLFFKEKISITDKLRGFIRDCDRLDDSWLREQLFNRIKQGTYNYDFMK